MRIKPEQLHKWYLEAIQDLHPDSFNPDANKPYDELSDEQKFIDKYIATCINMVINQNEMEKLDEIKERIDRYILEIK